MRVLIISANRERSPYPVAPLGALYIASASQNAGIETDFLDLSFSKNPKSDLHNKISKARYDAIGIGIRNLDNCFYTSQKVYTDDVVSIVEMLRKQSQALVILGGSGFSISPHGWMKITGADYGIIGEGESAFIELLNGVSSSITLKSRNNLLSKMNLPSDIDNASPVIIPEINSVSAPLHERCNYKKYVNNGGFVSIQTKRGCPYKCIYCVYPFLEGDYYRLREPANVAEEILSVSAMCSVRDFFFTDSVFNTPYNHAIQICSEIIKHGIKIRWMAYCNPLNFDNEMAEIMKRSGCAGIEFGLDAACPKMLETMGKPFTQKDISCAFAAAKKAGLPFAVHLLFGAPGETLADICETQKFLDSCETANAVFASFAIRIYENTPLNHIAVKEGYISENSDLFYPQYYIAKSLGDNPIHEIDLIAKKRPEWTTQTDWNKPLLKIVQRIVNYTGTRPQWKDIRNYGKHLRR